MAHSITAGLSRRRLLADIGLAAAGAIALTPSVPVVAGARSRPPEPGAEVATAWADLSLTLVQTTPGFTPPVASRAFAYWGISLYESVVDGSRSASNAGRSAARSRSNAASPVTARCAGRWRRMPRRPRSSDCCSRRRARRTGLRSTCWSPLLARGGGTGFRNGSTTGRCHMGVRWPRMCLRGRPPTAATRAFCETSPSTTHRRLGLASGSRRHRRSSGRCSRPGATTAAS